MVALSTEQKREKSRLQGNKDYNSLTKIISPLTKFPKFEGELDAAATIQEWPDHLLDLSQNAVVLNQMEYKDQIHYRNAFLIIKQMTVETDPGELLLGIEKNNGREAFRIVKGFFQRTTTAGKSALIRKFHTDTMERGDYSIIGWIAAVQKNGRALREAGGDASDSTMLSILLTGLLLPQFGSIKTILHQKQGLTLEAAKLSLVDHAQTEGLENVTKTRAMGGRNNTFYSEEKEKRGARFEKGYPNPTREKKQELCRDWASRKCRFGDRCWFQHKGPGACLPRQNEAPKQDKNASFTIQDKFQCQLCNGNHKTKNCNQVDPRDRPSLDYVFFAQEQPPKKTQRLQRLPSNFAEDLRSQDNNKWMEASRTETEQTRCPPSTEIPSKEDKHEQSAFSTYMLATMTFIIFLLAAVPNAGLRLLTQVNRVLRAPELKAFCFLVIFASLLTMVLGDTGQPPAMVQASSFLADGHNALGETFEWCSDSGTNRFVTNNCNDFIKGSQVDFDTNVAVGGGSVTSPSYGNVLVQSLGHKIMFKDVLYIPECGKKLVPTSPFVQKGFTVTYQNQTVSVLKPNGDALFSGEEIGGLYYFNCETVREKGTPTNYFGLSAGKNKAVSSTDFPKRLLEAHSALGHMNFDKVRKFLSLGKGENPDCSVCAMSKSQKDSLANKKLSRSTRVCHRSHMDVVYSGDYIFHLFVDDYSRKGNIVELKTKADALPTWISHKQTRENDHSPWKHAFVHSDSEKIYTSMAFENHCEQENMTHEYSSRYRHDQNGVVERAVQTIGVTHRCQMNQGNAPSREIPFSIEHANTIRNNSPTRANSGSRTPMEVETGLKLPPNRHLLKAPLFCLAFAHVYEEERKSKSDPVRGVPCVYLGFDQTNSTYVVRNWITGEVFNTADVTFHPNTFPYRSNPHRAPSSLHKYDALRPLSLEDSQLLNQHDAIQVQRAPEEPQAQRASQRQRDYRFSGGQAVGSIPDEDVAPGENSIVLTMQAPDPATLKEALESEDGNEWMEAELQEKNSFEQHDVLELVPRGQAKGRKIFKAKRVLKTRRLPPTIEEPLGPIVKRKIRMTIQAFSKMLKPGIDYAEKYASTVRFETILILVAIATDLNLDMMLTDIKTFFLYGDLEDIIFMEQVDEWVSEDKPKDDWICKLKKSMYGLPQASLCAQKKLKKTLLNENEFKQSTADDCVYVSQGTESDFVVLGAHVDDLVSVGKEDGLKKLNRVLRSEFEITVKQNPDVIMGMQLERDRERGWSKLHQEGYVISLLKQFGMEDCKATSTPMDPGTAKALMMLPTESTDPKVLKKYQSLVGAMLWLKTRPDMFFTINLLSRFLKSATQAHYDIARGKPLRYLQGTKNWGIAFKPGSEGCNISGESDADFAGDLDTSRTTLGVYEKIGECGTIMCRSSLERKICTSTGQAETYAMQSLTKNVVWTRHLMEDLGCSQKSPTPVFTDNDGVIKQSTKAINHTAAKHYRTAQAYIREKQASAVIKVGSVDTSQNAADMLTKALPKDAFFRHRQTIMGPQQPE